MNVRDRHRHNQDAARKLVAKIAEQLKRGANKGVEAAVRFLAGRWKETVSVPAPKTAIRGAALPGKKLGPILGYRATKRATPKAPPRMLSGRFRQGIMHKMLTSTVGLVGTNARSKPSKKYPQGFNYPRYLELGKSGAWGGGEHQSLKPTVEKYVGELRTIVGSEVKKELRVV